MESPQFWFWWFLTLLLCLWPLLRVWDRPRETLGFPVIASLMWLYLYVYLPFQAVTHLDATLQGLPVELAQFLSCASFACLLAGWYLRVDRPVPPQPPPARYDLSKLWVIGIGWLVIGNLGLYSFKALGGSAQNSSAYWYSLYNVGYAGIALCVATLALSRRHVEPLSVLLFLALIGGLAIPFMMGARRGPMFTVIIAASFAFMLARNRLPRLSVALGALAFAGFVMLVLLEARAYTYQGKTWEDALENMTLEDVMAKRSKQAMDNEFVNHCVQIQANLDTGQYQYGTVHLLTFLNWIPRAFWPDKPKRSAGWFFEARDYLRSSRLSNVGVGGAWGCVADAFNNYWYLCFFFWFAVGYLIAVVYTRAQQGGDLSWKMYYLGILMASHWLIAQCLSEALVPALMFEAVFWVSFRHCRLRPALAEGPPAPMDEPLRVSAATPALPVAASLASPWSVNGLASKASGKA